MSTKEDQGDRGKANCSAIRKQRGLDTQRERERELEAFHTHVVVLKN